MDECTVPPGTPPPSPPPPQPSGPSGPPSRARTVPLDPNSDKGRDVATRLTKVLAEIELAIAERRANLLRNPLKGTR